MDQQPEQTVPTCEQSSYQGYTGPSGYDREAASSTSRSGTRKRPQVKLNFESVKKLQRQEEFSLWTCLMLDLPKEHSTQVAIPVHNNDNATSACKMKN